ncbi:MAG: lipopolysaccharide biosynthesis protein [Geminicoccaceae bacterium]
MTKRSIGEQAAIVRGHEVGRRVEEFGIIDLMGAAEKVNGDTVARGVVWRIIEVFGTETLAFGSFVLLARLLAPDDFGLVSQASLFILTVQLVLQQGFPEALVQMEEVDEAHFESSFWANVLLGIAVAFILIVASPLVATILVEPSLGTVLISLSPTLVLLAANRIYLARLRRSFRFRHFMLLNVLATFAGALGAAILAFNGFGIWSLVAQQWLYALTGLIAGYLCTGWLPGLRLRMEHIRAMWAFSSMTVLEAMSAFCARRFDLLILALFWSAREIGFYFLANRLLFSAGMLTYYSISHLGLPFLARLQGDPPAYREAIYRTMQLLSLACMPTLAGLALVAPLLIPLLFGDEWTSSIRPFQVLAAFNIFYAMTLMCGQILIAAGHARNAMLLSGMTMVLFLAAVACATPYGIIYTAAAGGFANLLVLPVYLRRLQYYFGIDLQRWLKEQLPCLAATIAMIAMVWLTEPWMQLHLAPHIHLIAASFVGASTFVIAIVIVARESLLGVIRSFSSMHDKGQNVPA